VRRSYGRRRELLLQVNLHDAFFVGDGREPAEMRGGAAAFQMQVPDNAFSGVHQQSNLVMRFCSKRGGHRS